MSIMDQRRVAAKVAEAEARGDQSKPPSEITERSASYYEQEQLQRVLGEITKRRVEALRLYEPLPSQDRFHTSLVQERLLRGSNRGGKTLPAAVEIARAVTGQDPHRKYPKTDGRCVCVGKDGAHCADPMWQKLGRPGAFRIIRDLGTGLWRTYRPYDLGDLSRYADSRPAPPLIPPRYIKTIAWENKKANQPLKVTLHTGWEILFRSSEGKPPQGIDADLVWFDEEIIDPDWYPEMMARLLDRRGRFIWSCTPQAGTEQLYNIHKRFTEDDPLVEEVVVLLADNPHVPLEEKISFAARMSPEERRVRIEGEYAIIGHLVYPEYSKVLHNVPWFEIPETWCRFLAVDPGRQVCAVLFAAIPPSDECIYFYDELYIKQCTAEKLGEALAAKCIGHKFHSFLIDSRAARVHEMGSGVSVEQRYIRQLKKHRIRCETTGYGFTWAEDDVEAGILAFRSWLQSYRGTPHLRVLTNACPNFESEIALYHYTKVKGQPTDKPNKAHDHLMDCARYIAAADPEFSKPRKAKKKKSWAVRMIAEKKARERAKRMGEDRQHVSLGPGERA